MMDCARLGSMLAVAVAATAVPSVAHAVQRTVYLNLDATAISNTGNDPTMNAFSSTDFNGGTIDGWGALSDDDRDELLWWFKEAAVPFNIVFTYDRPAAGPYDMLAFGTAADATELFSNLGCSPAVGLADCTDTQGANISFLFWGCMTATQQTEMSRVAFNGLTALGFGWGLENLTSSGQVMASYTVTGVEFGDECTPINGTSQCTHSGCMAAQQNSTADLTARIGARVDDGPPVLTVLQPPDHSVTAADVTVEATVDDMFGGLSVTLEVVEAMQSLDDDMPPYKWDLNNIPDGVWTLRVTAIDADMNMVSEDRVICVGQNDCPLDTGGGESSTTAADETTSGGGETTSSGGGETSTGGDSSTGGETGGTIPPLTSTGTTAGFGGMDAATGCGCASDQSGSLGWLGALVLAGLLRRRRASVG